MSTGSVTPTPANQAVTKQDEAPPMMPSIEKDLRESMKILVAQMQQLRASKSSSPQAERSAAKFAKKIVDHITEHKGRYVMDGSGEYSVVIDSTRIPLTDDPQNVALIRLLLETCNITLASSIARATVQRLRVEAANDAHKFTLQRFAALSRDATRLYVPLGGGDVLRITKDGVESHPNGETDDSLWVEHAMGEALKYELAEDPKVGLGHFERLLVETQACRVSAMSWFVAMHEGFFPFIRELCPARMLVVHRGSSQAGKTSGAQRFTLLHGLGDVKGDYSVAALSSLGDIGLLVLDNKEQANFPRELIDFCLFLSTGADRGRSYKDGGLRTSASRPVGVITSIEGVFKAELQNRCVNVEYDRNGSTALRRGPIEREIQELRHLIGSAMMPVLRRYFEISAEGRTTPNPKPEYEEHFSALCNLLRAFGDVAGKPSGWAEEIIAAWDQTLRDEEPEDDELESLIAGVLDSAGSSGSNGPLDCAGDPGPFGSIGEIVFHGQRGTLYRTEAARLLRHLHHLGGRMQIPRNASGLSHRLKSSRFTAFQVLFPETAPEVPEMKRTRKGRPIGFFVPDDDVTGGDERDLKASSC